MTAYPEWLHILAWISLALALSCTLIVLIDIFRRPQKMGIMNVVWPMTTLYFGPLGLWAYFRIGRLTTGQHHRQMMATQPEKMKQGKEAMKSRPATRTQVSLGVTHCGAGCALGDIIAEWWVALVAMSFAGGVLQTRLLVDFALAWSLGVVFQYFTIAPMRGLSLGKGILVAIKADTIAIIAFQIGMSIWMVLSYYVFFPAPHLDVREAVFWFMMQIAMIAGFFTSYPANSWLLNKGFKEKMPEGKEAAMQLDLVFSGIKERGPTAA